MRQIVEDDQEDSISSPVPIDVLPFPSAFAAWSPWFPVAQVLSIAIGSSRVCDTLSSRFFQGLLC